ncbi:hypothetical protein CHS0354_038962 [Potamilus streckersoni]|uniref:Uncharacterized protein n=1 Tax=Potamilus streckersoni TaxID=2493646 RepID=A0AAE0VMG8_9BIVA|nr:hypothetical protein CHS0354_038962 [Potamilus streckersoni]
MIWSDIAEMDDGEVVQTPIVKVISTKKNIQESFLYKTKITTLDKERNQQILYGWNEPTHCGVLPESDVLEVLNLPDNSPDSVTIVVKITDVGHSAVRDYKEGYVHFSPPSMKYFFIISTERWESHRVSAQGSVYVSGNSKDVKVTFPPSSTSEECAIDIQNSNCAESYKNSMQPNPNPPQFSRCIKLNCGSSIAIKINLYPKQALYILV